MYVKHIMYRKLQTSIESDQPRKTSAGHQLIHERCVESEGLSKGSQKDPSPVTSRSEEQSSCNVCSV